MKFNFNAKKNKKAFTLIELLIVIAIIGILFIVLVSKVDFATDKAKTTGVQTDFRSFQVAFDQVAKENAGFNSFGWDLGDKSDDSLWNGKTTPDGQAYSYENAGKDVGDRIRNSYDKGDANLNGIMESTETWVGRKIYTETWTGTFTLINPATRLLDTHPGYKAEDYSAIAALERAINANLDPKLHITINDDYTITMANQARDPWGNEYHGYYLSNAAVDDADRGAFIIYSDGPNGKNGSIQTCIGGIVTVSVPGNNIAGQDDLSIVSCYTYANGHGETKTMTTGFNNNQKFLSGGNGGNVGSSMPMLALEGTKWKFNERITYDESVFDMFDYENQTGWEDFSDGCYITNGSVTYQVWGLAMNEAFGYTLFGPVQSISEPLVYGYLVENEFGIPAGWFIFEGEFVIKFLNGEVTDPYECLDYMHPTIAPTIVFSDTTAEVLQRTVFIEWMQDNAEQK